MASIHDSGPGSQLHRSTHERARSRASRASLIRRSDQLEAIIAAGRIGYLRLDRGSHVLAASSQFKVEFGLAPDALFDWEELLGRVVAEDREALSAAVTAAFAARSELEQIVRMRWDCSGLRWLALRGRTLSDAAGVARELIIVARDVTAQRRALTLQMLHGERVGSDLEPTSGAALGETPPAAGLAVFEMDLESDALSESQELAAQLGVSERRAPRTYGAWLRRVHAEDRERIDREIRHAADSHEPAAVEFRVVRPDGTARWLSFKGRALCDGEGRAHRLVAVCEDVTSRRYADAEGAATLARERELRAAAERASRSKDDFLATVSHDLRSPLNAVLGWNRILAVKRADDPEVLAVAARIERSAKAQLRTVEDLLDLGRLGTGKLTLAPRALHLASVISAAVEAARPAADGRQVELETTFVDRGELFGDPRRLQQAVSHLLANALACTDAGGRVLLQLATLGDEVILNVTDSGRGIDPALLAQISAVEPPTGVPGSTGLGLGLRLAREIVALHRGSIGVHSEVNRGTTFTLRLPALRAGIRATSAPPAAAPAGRNRLAGLSVLVVDDEADARTVVAETLRLEGARVVVTEGALAAFAALTASDAHFDVLVTDIGMPREDGYSLVRRVRGLAVGRHLIVIALTGYGSLVDRAATISAGFDDLIAKPVDYEEFVQLTARLSRSRAGAAHN